MRQLIIALVVLFSFGCNQSEEISKNTYVFYADDYGTAVLHLEGFTELDSLLDINCWEDNYPNTEQGGTEDLFLWKQISDIVIHNHNFNGLLTITVHVDPFAEVRCIVYSPSFRASEDASQLL